jgi:hypothetical protein
VVPGHLAGRRKVAPAAAAMLRGIIPSTVAGEKVKRAVPLVFAQCRVIIFAIGLAAGCYAKDDGSSSLSRRSTCSENAVRRTSAERVENGG